MGAPPRGSGGASVRLADIPNAPKPQQMPLVSYPDIPTIRQAYREPISGFDKRAAMLQQSPLPEGFARGGALLTEAAKQKTALAGKGALAMGGAISEGLQSVAKGADAMADLQARVIASVNEIASKGSESKVRKMADERLDLLANEGALKYWTPDQFQVELDKLQEAITRDVMAIPASPAQLDENLSIVEGKFASFRQKVRGENTKRTLQGVYDDNNAWMDRAVATDNRDEQVLAAAKMLETQQIDIVQHGILTRNLKQGWKIIDVNKTIQESAASAQMIEDESRKVLEGGTSSIEILNERDEKNVPYAAKFFEAAKNKVTLESKEWVQGWDKSFAQGKTATNEMIQKDGADRGIPQSVINSVKNLNPASHAEVHMDMGKYSEAVSMVAQYKFENDVENGPDGKPVPSVRQLTAIRDYIVQNVDKSRREELLNKLYRKHDDGRAGVQPERNKILEDDYHKEIDAYIDAGVMKDPTAGGKRITRGIEKEGGKTRIDKEAMRRSGEVRRDLQNKVTELLNSPKAATMTETELRTEFDKILSPYMAEEAVNSVSPDLSGREELQRPRHPYRYDVETPPWKHGLRRNAPASPHYTPRGLEERYEGEPDDMPDSSSLRDDRARFIAELRDPRIYRMFNARIQGEVGGQGRNAILAFVETVLNRAASRGQSLAQTLVGDYWGGGLVHGRDYSDVIDRAMSGSNISNFATGNWSGKEGRGFGPRGYLVRKYGGEQFGVEDYDIGWAARKRRSG